jgi:hypothetical protein
VGEAFQPIVQKAFRDRKFRRRAARCKGFVDGAAILALGPTGVVPIARPLAL